MKKQFLITLLILCSLNILGQENKETATAKKRLDFAKTYFEVGSSFFPSFTGKQSKNNTIQDFENSASISPYLSWGGFHFWGHAEFYVSFPLSQFNLNENDESSFELKHNVVTGGRFLPWAYQPKKLRPYIGLSWSGLDFRQTFKPDEEQPTLSKDFMLVPDIGLLYGYKDFSFRLGASYFHNNTWQYPITKTTFQEVKTPKFNFQVGVLYAFDASKNTNTEAVEEWNNYDIISKPTNKATTFGDFFVGVGPSGSMSLNKSTYNQSTLPYLKDRLISKGYFDVAVGYHFNKAGIFSALSFRNPEFETTGYGTFQNIKKTSLALEVNKYLTDYSGFTPYIGLNVSYDKIKYEEQHENQDTSKYQTFNSIEPGVTFGWDILPGKTNEVLVLRTNLRWYPFSSFNIDDKKFDFSQLEYNLIQLVFYPSRYLRGTNKVK